VAVVHAVEREQLQSVLGEVFWHYDGFIAAAEGLVARLPELSLADARAELGSLSCSASASITAAPPAAAFERAIDADPDVQSYALYALASAFAAKHPGLTLDCAAQDASQARLWLTLAARVAERTHTTTCILYAPVQGRMLIGIDAWHPGQLRAIADPGFSFDQLWPLTTERKEARAHARSALAQAGPALLSPRGASLRELADQLARFSQDLRA
jgi:hypothetical protein